MIGLEINGQIIFKMTVSRIHCTLISDIFNALQGFG